MLRNKKSYVLIFLVTVVIYIFQIKKSKRFSKNGIIDNTSAQITSEYDKLLTYYPVYKDSIYYIYVATISEAPKIIYLKKNINTVQKESKFFVHIYPKDSSLLKQNQGFLSFDFKNNVTEYNLKGRNVFISERELPKIGIKKINTGQYGFRGNSEISWRITQLLTAESIKKNILENEEDIRNFDN